MQSYLRLIQRNSCGIRRKLSTGVLTQDASNAISARSSMSALVSHFSTDAAVSAVEPPNKNRYAVVNHAEAYESAMQGLHGAQLALARLEGVGKDEPSFDPFMEEELAALEAGDEDDDDDYGDDVVEAEYVDPEEEEFEEDEGDDALESLYNPDGSLRRKKSALATLRAGFPAGGLLAVIEMGGAQHKVTTDDLIVVNRLQPVDKYKIGTVHTLTDVMLVGSSHMTLVGIPFVAGAEVDVMVEEITRDAKVIIFKKRRRKNSQRRNGFRRDVTLLRVVDIRLPDEYKDHSHVGREIVDELEDRSSVQAPQLNAAQVEQ